MDPREPEKPGHARFQVAGSVFTRVGLTQGGSLSSGTGGKLRVGMRAPEFTARLSNGEIVRLSEYRGKQNVVLSFYPRDFSPGCTKQICAYRDNYDTLRRLDAVLLCISYDDPSSHNRFVNAHRLPFHLVTDRDRSLSRRYGVARLRGVFPLVRRMTFVIDKGGIIRRIAHHEMNLGRHVEGAIETLQEIQKEVASGER